MARRKQAASTTLPDAEVIPVWLLPWDHNGDPVPVTEARHRSRALDTWLEAHGISTAPDRDSRRHRAQLIAAARQAHGIPDPPDPRTHFQQER